MSNLEGKGATIYLKKYKDTWRRHMIIHGMWDVFIILDLFDTIKTWDLFHHTACFTMLTLVSHVE